MGNKIFVLTEFVGDEWDWTYVPRFFVYTQKEAEDWRSLDYSNHDWLEVSEYVNPNP